jgi:hypothetical protein
LNSVQLLSAFQQLSGNTELTHQNAFAADEPLHISPTDEPLSKMLFSTKRKCMAV